MHSTLQTARLFDDALLVRIVGHRQDPAELLPQAPPATMPSVVLAHPGTAADMEAWARSGPVAAISRRGYRLAEVTATEASSAVRLDVLVTADSRRHAPEWWDELQDRATRIFDLRFGPVRHVFQGQLDRHALALAGARRHPAWRLTRRPAT